MGTMPVGDQGETLVPSLIGLEVPEARQRGEDAGLVVVGPRPDGPPLGVLTWPGVFVVTAQRPPPGTRLRRGDMVVIDFRKRGRGDESGDREPRDPPPSSGLLAVALDLPGLDLPEPGGFKPQEPFFEALPTPGATSGGEPSGTGGAQAPKRRSRRA